MNRNFHGLIVAFALLAYAPAFGQGTTTISNLPSATLPLAGTEVVPVVQGGVTKKVAVSNFTGGAGTPCSTIALSLQYNAAGSFGCIAGVTSDGTSILFAAGNLKILGSSSGSVILNAPATGGGTLTLPQGTDTLAGLAATQAFTNKTYNGNTWTAGTGALTLGAGKAFTASNTLTIAGTDGSTLNVGAGGTLGSNAFTSTAYAPLASPTFTGTVTVPTGGVLNTPASINLSNATAYPVASLAGLGSGVATALAAAHDTTGGICTVGGIGCPAGGGTLTVTDGTHSVTSATTLTFGNGLLVGGSAGSATVGPSLTLNAQSGTTYPLVAGDGGKLINASNAGAKTFTVSVATTSGFGSGYSSALYDTGAAGLTLTATISTFDNGSNSVSSTQGQELDFWSDGTNYHATLSLPIMAQDTILGTFGSANYPVAQSIPACANDGSHALVYASHAIACETITGGSGVPSIAGTANQVNESGSPGATTLSLSSTLILPGTLSAPSLATSGTPASSLCQASGGSIFAVSAANCFAGGGSGGPPNFGFQATTIYGPPDVVATSAIAVVAGTVYFSPIYFTAAQAWTKQGIQITVLSTGTCDVGVYANSGGLPTGSPIVDASLSATGTGYPTATISWTPTAYTPYFEAVQCSGTPTVVAAAAPSFVSINGFAGSLNSGPATRISQTGVYGTPGSSLPTAAAASSNAASPIAGFQR